MTTATTTKSRMWKDGARRGIVYVEEREAAEKVMALGGATNPVLPVASRRPVQPQRRRTASVASRPAAASVSPVEAELKGHAAMAVYLDRKGKPFAWQIPFAMEHWDHVTTLVGAEAA